MYPMQTRMPLPNGPTTRSHDENQNSGMAVANTVPTIPRNLDEIEANNRESLACLGQIELALEGPPPAKCGDNEKMAHEPGIMDRMRFVNNTSYELRMRLESLLTKLAK